MSLDIATQLARKAQTILGANLVAAILHGSAVLDAFVPGESDVDLLLVVAGRLSNGDAVALRDAAMVAGSRVDLRVVTEETAGGPTASPFLELGVGVYGAGVHEDSNVFERDLVLEFSLARAHGKSLLGPPPEEVLGPVPDEWIVEYGDELLAQWQGRIGEVEQTDQMTFAACRIWRFAAERTYCSKAVAARWALERDPALVAVHEALAGCVPTRTDLGALLAHVRDELPRPSSRSARGAR